MQNNKTIAFGCFYKVPLCEVDDAEEEKKEQTLSEEMVLIGCIYATIEKENYKNEVMFAKIDAPRWH